MEIDRGDIWLVDLNPVTGHEQAGTRPALVISDNLFNHGLSGLVIIIPITGKFKNIPSHVELESRYLNQKSYLKTEDIRSVSTRRMIKKIGTVDKAVLDQVESKLKLLLGFNSAD